MDTREADAWGTSSAVASRLRGLPLFQGLDDAAMARLSTGAYEVNARDGTEIYRRGQSGLGLYVVIYGQVKLVLQASQSTEKIVELVGTNGCLGGSSIVLNRPHVLTAVAIAETRLAFVTRQAVLAELERTPAFASSIAVSLSHRLRYLIGALENCMVRSGTERVVGYLLDQLPPEAVNGRAMVMLPAQKGVIASQLNLTQEHFSRILRGLATAAMIEVDGRTVRIRDVDELRAYCPQA